MKGPRSTGKLNEAKSDEYDLVAGDREVRPLGY